MYVLEDYTFLEPLVKAGEVEDSNPFNLDGICFVDNKTSPKVAYVFHVQKDCIWWSYAWAESFNKSFYMFHNQVIQHILSFGLPLRGTHLGDVFKNHNRQIGKYKNSNIYEWIR